MRKLKEAGILAKCNVYEGAYHGFDALNVWTKSVKECEKLVEEFKYAQAHYQKKFAWIGRRTAMKKLREYLISPYGMIFPAIVYLLLGIVVQFKVNDLAILSVMGALVSILFLYVRI